MALVGCQTVPSAATTSDILKTALAESQAYEKLHYLCDRIGHRLSGSENLARAVDWAAETMKRDGLANVHKQKVMVPHWVRGEESAWIVEPARQQLCMLGLGGSVGTPPGGITAEVVVVKSFDELSERVRGKIVLYNAAFTDYGATVQYRVSGASRAAKFGALAALVRSVGPVSLRTPHTGTMHYEDNVPKIPTAAVTIEDAEMMQRMQDRKEDIRVHLTMNAKTLPDAESANVIGEVPGQTNEIVVIGGHLDSWDVGTGAHDDGAGCAISMEAARILVKMGLKPRRTIRVVLFTNEENGTRGGNAYRDGHQHEIKNHAAAIEADLGADSPLGFGVSLPDKDKQARALATLREIVQVLAPIGATRVRDGGGGVDIGPLSKDGVPIMSLDPDPVHYWDIHHTPADTLDKIDPHKLNRNVAAMAVMAFAIADMPQRLGE
jgi:carboxypeptidase Q